MLHLAEKSLSQGSAWQEKGVFQKARVAFEKSHEYYQKLKNPLGAAQTALHIADASRQLEDFDTAALWHRKAEYAIRKNFKSHFREQTIYLDLEIGKGLVARAQGKFEIARGKFIELHERYQSKNDLEGMAFSLWSLGTTLRYMGRFEEAELDLRRSLECYRHLNDQVGLAYARCALGGVLRMRGDASGSGEAYEVANRMFHRMKDLFGLAYSFCGIGNSYRMLGELKTGINFSKKAMKIYSRLGQKGPLGFVLWSLAQGEIALEKWKAANTHLRNAEKLFQNVKDTRGLVYVALGWGDYYRIQKNPRALSYYRKARLGALKLKLPFEETHALREMSLGQSTFKSQKVLQHVLKLIFRRYQKCGVLPSFMSYQTLP